MSVPVLQTKIIPPRWREEILSRERLIEQFGDLLDRKLVLISAPAGYGKTSLLIDLAHRRELPFCWFSLDPFDKDLQRFLAHFIASIRLQFPTFGEQVLAALQLLDSQNPPLEQVWVILVNEIYETIREHFVIVLDDYQAVDDRREINDFINWFVQAVDQNCHMVILTRSLLPLPDLPLMYVRGQVGALGTQELAFKADEIQAFMFQNYHQIVPLAIAEDLAQKSEGWITGLLLSAQNMWSGMVDQLESARLSGVGLYDFLISQVLNHQPPEVREILLKTALPDEFDLDLCKAIFGEPPEGYSWRSALQAIQSGNLFVLPLGEDGTWLRYHPLFQEFLQAQMAKERPAEMRILLRRLVAFYAERAEWERGYGVCQRLEEPDTTAALLERAAGPLLTDGRSTLLGQWLDALPLSVLRKKPLLIARQGLVLAMRGETSTGLSMLDEAIAHFRTGQDNLCLALALSWRALVHHIRVRHALSLGDAEEALSLARGRESDPGFDWVAPEAYRICGMNYRTLGKLDKAIASFSRSLELYEASGDEKNIHLLLLNLGAAYSDAGDLIKAQSCYQPVLDYFAHKKNYFFLCSVLNDMAVVYHLQGDFLKAFAAFEEALTRSRQSAHQRVEAMVLVGLGDLYRDLDTLQDAAEAYRLARPAVEKINDRFLMVYLDLAEAATARLHGDITRANLYLNASRQLVDQDSNGNFRGLYQLEFGRLALTEQNFTQARDSLDEAVQLFDQGGQKLEGARARLLLAAAHFGLGETTAAEARLQDAFDLASTWDDQHFMYASARLAMPLLKEMCGSPSAGRQALRLSEQVEEFKGSLTQIRRRLRRQSTVVTPAPPHLQIRALGQSRVLLGKQPVTSADWQTHITHELFFLILSRRNGWRKEALGEILWPESSPSELKLRFKNSIYRLRRAIPLDVVLFDGDCYQFNWDLDYEYDVERFWEYVHHSNETEDREEQIKVLQTAVDLYQGDYLTDVDGAWVLQEQADLRNAFLQATRQLAQLYFDSQQFDRSLQASNRLIAADPCMEAASAMAMRASAGLGDRQSVERIFQNLVQALHTDLNVEPSPATTALYRSLMR